MASFIDTSSLLPQVASRGIPDDYERLQTSPDTFGAGFGRALEQTGQDLTASAGFWGKVTADNAYNDYADKVTKLAYGDPNSPKKNADGTTEPDTGYFGLRGRDALTARPQIEAQMASAYQSARSKLQSPDAQLAFDGNARRLHTMMSERVGSHADQQSFEFAKATNTATDTIHLNAIASNPTDDKLFETHLDAIVGAAQQNAQIGQGAHPGDDQWTAAGVDATARAWDARLVSIAATDPVKAQAMLNAHRADVGDKFADLAAHIRLRATAANGDAAADQAIHETATGAPLPAGSPRVQNAVAVGDSLANGVQTTGKIGGDTLVGRPSNQPDPKKPPGVLQVIEKLPQNTGNLPIVLSSGISNDGAAANPNVVAQQIAALHDKGYRDIRVLGVGDKFAQFNPAIQKIAEANGAKFVSIGPNDGVHPTDGYKTATQGALGGAGGGSISSGPAANIDPSIPAEGRALLAVIGGPESAGRYNVRYGGATFEGYADHPRIHERIANGPNAGNVSDAAGRYQFISSTWDAEKAKLGLTDFSPKSQDIAAWDLAQTDYKKQTGRDLLGDLRSNDPSTMSRVAQTLRLTWTSLPGGAEQGTTQSKFESSFRAALNGQGQTYATTPGGGAPGGQPTAPTPNANGLPVTDAAFTPAQPGQLQPAPGAPSPRQMEADAIRRIEARGDLDDNEKQHAVARIQRTYATAQLASEQDAKTREEDAKTATVDYMRRIHNGDIKAVDDLYRDPRLASDPGAIKELQTFAQNAGVEDKSSWGPAYQSAFDRQLLPFGDPRRISTPEQILKLANGEPGTLTSSGVDRLLHIQSVLQKPDEAALHAAAAGVLNGVKKQISFQGDGQFDPKDPKGEAAFNLRFVPSFWSAFDAWRAEGKNPWDFLKDDKTISALVKASARKPDEMKWDQLQAEGAQIVQNPDAEKLPFRPAPDGVDPKVWSQVVSERKFVLNTPKGYVRPVPQKWADVLNTLVSDPTPENIERFDNSMWGKAANNDGATLVKKLAASAVAAPALAPAPAATPEPAPGATDQPEGSQSWLRQGFNNLMTTPEERERQAKAKVETAVGPQPEPTSQGGGFMDALGNLLTNPAQNDARKEEKRKRHIAEGREPPK